jgi:hypothetical protein
MVDKIQTIEQMRKILEEQDNPPILINESTKVHFDLTKEEKEWINSIYISKEDEFVLYLEFNEHKIIVFVKELDWITTQNIEVASYKRGHYTGNNYYSGEYECREILSKSIICAIDLNEKEAIYNKNNDIMSFLPGDLINIIWINYLPLVTLTAHEAKALYECSMAYFKGDTKNMPIPSLIIEVDMIIKIGNLSRQELRQIKSSEMQKIKLILKARSEALQLLGNNQTIEDKKINLQTLDIPDNLLPPELKGQKFIGQR